MKKKQAGKKQEHIQDASTIAKIAKANHHKQLTKDKIYPALTDATVSIDEAKMLLGVFSSIIMEEAMATLRQKKVGESRKKILKILSPDGAREKEIDEFLAIFESETLFDTRALIEGLKAAIEHTIMMEMRGRTLNSITPDWESMMTSG